MTKNKAIEEVKNYENYPNGLSKECRDYIIKVLEQEPIIDKIQEEIKRVVTVCHASNNHDELIRRNVVLQILDKFKVESEE